MIEVIYKDEKQEAKGNEGVFSVPKNIRQIGSIGEDYRIYMEDYVYTFLRKAAGAEKNGEDEKNCLAVLTGECKWAAGVTYIFVKGALTVDNAEATSEHIDFSEETWQKIQEDAGKYFEGQEITGWFFAQKSLPMEASELFQKIHLKYFGGGEKVLMLMDPAEREEAFFRYENSFLVRQNGYYIYYEKNTQMQAYMLEKNPGLAREDKEEIPDEAVKAFRKIIKKKKSRETEETEDRTSVFSYAATACLVLAVAAVGMRFYQNYRGVQNANTETEAVSAMLEGGEEENSAGDGEKDFTESAAETSAEVETAETQAEETENDTEESSSDIAFEKEKNEKTDDDIDDGTNTASANGNNMQESEEETVRTGTEEITDTEKNEKAEDKTSGVIREEEEGGLSEEDAAIYREESDVRKANRRVQSARENDGQTEEVKTENSETTDTASSGSASYIIRPGDTLYQISMEKYGNMDEVAEICRLNGISEDEIIYPGQIIVLP